MTSELYLSRLILNPLNSRVHTDIRDCQKMHCRVMSGFPKLEEKKEPAEKKAREHFGVLYRVDWKPKDKRLTLLVQSNIEPSWNGIPDDYLLQETDELNPAWRRVDDKFIGLGTGDRLSFRLRANPTRKIGKTKLNDKLCGKRVEIYDEAEQIAWLERKSLDGGFALTQLATGNGYMPRVQIAPEPRRTGWRPEAKRDSCVKEHDEVEDEETADKILPNSARKNNHYMRFGSVVFDGVLQITNAEMFIKTLRAGIGTGKAYGFGLLSIAATR